jgi:hypothetical protein
MNMDGYISEIKLKLTGSVLELELDDSTLIALVNSALRETQRYIDITALKTIPFKNCIDLNEYKDLKINTVASVHRSRGYAGNTNSGLGMRDGYYVDPMQAAQWQLLSGTGNMINFSEYTYNYGSWNTLLQIRNTTSTDLAFRFDRMSNKLYVNCSSNIPDYITISYVPRFDNVEEIISDFWVDVIIRMSVALAKITLGRIRTKYTQSNALWQNDGATILAEGTQELSELRQALNESTQLVYPID